MPAPAFGSIGTLITGSGSTASFPVPSGVAAGDLIVVAFYMDGTNTVTAMASGFAHAPNSPVQVNWGGGGQHSLNVLWKRATASDTGTYDFTLSANTYRHGRALRYTGVIASGNPWDSTASAESGNTGVSASPAVSVTTLGPDRLLTWFASNWAGGTWTPPSGFTERFDSNEGSATGADKAQATAGSSGSVSGTCTGTDKSGAWLGALKPVSNDVSSDSSLAVAATITASGGGTSSPSSALSATITASGQVSKFATASMSLSATLTPVGAGPNAAATSSLTVAMVATGVVGRSSAASMSLAVGVTPSGGSTIGATTDQALAVTITAAGLSAQGGAASVGMAVAITATGYKSSGVAGPTRWVRISGTWVVVP